jgi:hypothetical protein
VESRYLTINGEFLEDIRRIYKALKDKEKELDVELDGEADLDWLDEVERRSKLAQGFGSSFPEIEKMMAQLVAQDEARKHQRAEVHALQRSVVAPMRDLIKRYGAVWVEEVRDSRYSCRFTEPSEYGSGYLRIYTSHSRCKEGYGAVHKSRSIWEL